MTQSHTPTPWQLGYKGAGGWTIGNTAFSFDCRSPACTKEAAHDMLNRLNSHDALVAALRILHDETVDYVRLNNLGDPWHNQSMQMARAALAAASEG